MCILLKLDSKDYCINIVNPEEISDTVFPFAAIDWFVYTGLPSSTYQFGCLAVSFLSSHRSCSWITLQWACSLLPCWPAAFPLRCTSAFHLSLFFSWRPASFPILSSYNILFYLGAADFGSLFSLCFWLWVLLPILQCFILLHFILVLLLRYPSGLQFYTTEYISAFLLSILLLNFFPSHQSSHPTLPGILLL